MTRRNQQTKVSPRIEATAGNISSEKMERRGCLDRVSAATWPLCQERLRIGWKWRVTELDGPSTSHAVDPTPDKARTGLT